MSSNKSSIILFPFDISKAIFTPNGSPDEKGLTPGEMIVKFPGRCRVTKKGKRTKYQYRFERIVDEDDEDEEEQGEVAKVNKKRKFEEDGEPTKNTKKRSKMSEESKRPRIQWRKDWVISKDRIPENAHIYEDVQFFKLDELKESKAGLRVVQPDKNVSRAKPIETVKPHFESALGNQQIENWLAQWKPYGYRIYFYPYEKQSIDGRHSKDKRKGTKFENWIELSLNTKKEKYIVNADWKIPVINLQFRAAKGHFDKWKEINIGAETKKTDKPYEVYRVFIRQNDEIYSVPLGAVYPHLVRHSATPCRNLKSQDETKKQSSKDEEISQDEEDSEDEEPKEEQDSSDSESSEDDDDDEVENSPKQKVKFSDSGEK